jgi:predicted acylesterase/phospholipase RssA
MRDRCSIRAARAALLYGLASVVACAPARIDTRPLFASLTYPTSSAPPPPPDRALQVFANLELEAITAYRNPQKMAACLRILKPRDIEAFGEELVKAGTSWARVAGKIPVYGACGEADDPALVRYVIARLATSATSMARSVSISEDLQRCEIYDKVPTALAAIADILEKTPARSEATEDAPALALSGGSSNGAFTAGFLFELFSLRERALPPEGDGGKYRFSAVVGTSVGALISQVVDLYYVDPATPVTATKAKLLDDCNGYWTHKPTPTCMADVDTQKSTRTDCFGGWPPDTGGLDADTRLSGLDAATRADLAARHPRQMCALTKLYKYFTDDDEQTLMCVEPGPITGAVDVLGRPHQNLMRFDPMYFNAVGPVLDDYSDETIANDITRVVVSVEIEQNQSVGLDERVCGGLPAGPAVNGQPQLVGGREYCLGGGVMASLVLPFFARPVRHVYDGITPGGRCGTWFDGGLRSGFPAYRALRMTRPAMRPLVADDSVPLRVLAISTGRFEGMPSPRPVDITKVAFDAIDQMSNSNQVDEIELAQQMALVREDQLYELKNGAKRDKVATVDASGTIDVDASISAVYVPSDAPDQIIAGGEYSFDRYIMRGLWLWGRRVALQRVFGDPTAKPATPGLFERLGWKALEAKALAFANQDMATMKPWLDAYSLPECGDHANARTVAGRGRINGCVAQCPEVEAGATTFPQHLVCPKPPSATPSPECSKPAGAK